MAKERKYAPSSVNGDPLSALYFLAAGSLDGGQWCWAVATGPWNRADPSLIRTDVFGDQFEA